MSEFNFYEYFPIEIIELILLDCDLNDWKYIPLWNKGFKTFCYKRFWKTLNKKFNINIDLNYHQIVWIIERKVKSDLFLYGKYEFLNYFLQILEHKAHQFHISPNQCLMIFKMNSIIFDLKALNIETNAKLSMDNYVKTISDIPNYSKDLNNGIFFIQFDENDKSGKIYKGYDEVKIELYIDHLKNDNKCQSFKIYGRNTRPVKMNVFLEELKIPISIEEWIQMIDNDRLDFMIKKNQMIISKSFLNVHEVGKEYWDIILPFSLIEKKHFQIDVSKTKYLYGNICSNQMIHMGISKNFVIVKHENRIILYSIEKQLE